MDYSESRLGLSEGKRFIYVMTRLYDFTEKIRGSMLETATIKGVQQAFSELEIDMQFFPTFLPFRDTREDEIVSDSRTRILYNLDMKRLKKVFAVVGSLDDPSKDDGICMELGYAACKGVPTLVIVNDFIWYVSRAFDNLSYVLDPVLIRLVGKLIHLNALPPSKSKHIDLLFSNMKKVKKDYYMRALFALRDTMKVVQQEVREMVISPEKYVTALPKQVEINRPSVYLEFEGGKYEWQREYMNKLSNILRKHKYVVLQSLRHNPSQQKRIYGNYGKNAVRKLGEIDITSAISADVIVTCGDGSEVDGGTAAIQGLARSLSKKIIMYYSGNVETRAEGGHRMIRNLMLQYSADKVVYQIKHVVKAIEDVAEADG